MTMWTIRTLLYKYRFGTKCPEVATCRQEWRLFSWPGHLPGEKEALCSFSHLLSTLYRPLLWPSALACVWGVVNLLEGYGSDNPGSKSQGMKQFMAN